MVCSVFSKQKRVDKTKALCYNKHMHSVGSGFDIKNLVGR